MTSVAPLRLSALFISVLAMSAAAHGRQANESPRKAVSLPYPPPNFQGGVGRTTESSKSTLQGTANEIVVIGNGEKESFDYLYSIRDQLGGPLHYNHMPVPWSWALNTPFQWTKRYASHFGGTRNGLVTSWP